MTKEKILWVLFGIIVGTSFIHLISLPLGVEHPLSRLTEYSLLVLPVMATILHALWTLGTNRALLLLSISASVGFVSEVIGLNTGVLFGGEYIYTASTAEILNVPISVILFWAVFIYTGYNFTTSFLYWNNKRKPTQKKNSLSSLLPLILLDGFLIVAIDIFLDPLQVRQGTWRWTQGGQYFGIPLGNFLGWFIVAVVSTGLFRLYEYLKPQKPPNIKFSVFVLPVLSYGLLAGSLLIAALYYQMWTLAFIGSLFMFPQIFINLFAFAKFKQTHG